MRQSLESTREIALDALGSAVRRQILGILAAGPVSVGDIAEQLPVSRPAVSRHLRLLTRAQLVTHERRATRNVFRLNGDGFQNVRSYLDEFWDQALPRFAARAEALEREGR